MERTRRAAAGAEGDEAGGVRAAGRGAHRAGAAVDEDDPVEIDDSIRDARPVGAQEAQAEAARGNAAEHLGRALVAELPARDDGRDPCRGERPLDLDLAPGGR